MNIDISKFEFEECFESMIGNTVLYFIAPKELVAEKYPEAEHATISIEFNDGDKDMSSYDTMISPTKDGEDYDWIPFELDIGDIEQLVTRGLIIDIARHSDCCLEEDDA